MADAAMTVLLETLSHVLVSCSDLISGAEDELRLLREDVESFRAFLRSVANKRKDEAFRKKDREIAEAVYDAQDTIDSFLMEAAAAQSKIDPLGRRRQVLWGELVSRVAEEAAIIREFQVQPLLDEAKTDFPEMFVVSDSKMADHAAAAALLEKISNLSMILGVDSDAEEELRQLRNEVELMRLFVENAADKPNGEEPFRKAEREMDELFLFAQEKMDSYFSQEAAARSKIDLFRRRRDLPGISSLAEVVRSVTEDELKVVFEKARVDFAEMLLIGDGSETTVEEEPHQLEVKKVWSISEDKSVSVEDEQAAITGYLKHETEELDFISIIGTAGMGKTTLARRVYQSQEIQYEFPTRIWVTVSQNPEMTDVFRSILKEVTSKDMERVNFVELRLAVHKFLEKRKFFLVLDDVWTPMDFYDIEKALPKSNRSSKVLITSRELEVGQHAMRSIEPHRMRYLREDECWELLQLQVFGGLHICPPELIEIGQHIAAVCNGLPLTVVIIGGILVAQLSKTQSISALKIVWIKVCDYMRRYIDDGPSELIFRAVVLGNYILPNELGYLFLYLGVFPEDYEIFTTTLIRLWIAEGFIQHQERRSLEDTAEEKLDHLIQRNLVIVDKVKSNGKVKSCHLHDSVRGFCIWRGMEVNLFGEIELFREAFPGQKKLRRLGIHSDPLKLFSSRPYFPIVRSFSCFGKTETLLLPEDTSKVPGDAFELLRVLDIKHIRFTRFPLELTHLFCLRYIVFSSDFKILPEVVSKLRNIQTLIIHTSSRTLEIKADIWKMIQLRHLRTNASIILRKEPENHSDQKLHTLSNLSPENCTRSVVHRAGFLKKLGIRGTLPILLDGEVGSRKFDHFEKLKNLENLRLINDVHLTSPSECQLSCLPPTESFPPKLRSLTLSATFLSWEHMAILGMLEKLEVLKLKDNAFVGECWEVADGNFPSLQVLHIGYTNLVFWKVARGHFPKLRSLALRNCEKLV